MDYTYTYQLWPMRLKRNTCWRFGMGSRWETKTDGSRRVLGWSFFIGQYRLIFGRIY